MLPACALLLSAACADDSPANRYFHAAEDLHDATCACGFESRGPCNVRFETFVSCQLDVVRDYEDEIGDFLDCAAELTVGQTRCVKRVGCDEARVDACLDLEIDDRCGELPDPISEQLDDEIDARCDNDGDDDDCTGDGCDVDVPASFLCDNGNQVTGDVFCDGVDDCGDGSDELCSGMGVATSDGGMAAAGSGGAGGSPAGVAGGGGASPDPALACVDTTLANGGELVSLGCAQCLCTISPMEITGCGAECWDLIRCSMEHCGFPERETDLPCLQMSCSTTLVASATSALTLANTARVKCRNACPLIVP